VLRLTTLQELLAKNAMAWHCMQTCVKAATIMQHIISMLLYAVGYEQVAATKCVAAASRSSCKHLPSLKLLHTEPNCRRNLNALLVLWLQLRQGQFVLLLHMFSNAASCRLAKRSWHVWLAKE
jgi:hypothetical protein